MPFKKPKPDLTPPWEFAPIGKNKPKKKPTTKPKKKPKGKDEGWENYKKLIKELTELNKLPLEGVETRSFSGFHIDHKISKRFGYDNSIPAEHISHPSNLHMMWWYDNLAKGMDNIVDELNSWILIK